MPAPLILARMGRIHRFADFRRCRRADPSRLPASIDEGNAKKARYQGYYSRSPWSKASAYRRSQSEGQGGSHRGGSSTNSSPFLLICLFLIGAVFAATLLWLRSDGAQANAAAPLAFVSPTDRERATFGFCHQGGGINCIVDGDTLYYQGVKIRIADIDTPETHEPRCPEEARKGSTATRRLHALLNAGAFSLEPIDRDEDVHGRKLRILTRGGESLGGVLVGEGLARWYAGGRQPWC